MICDYAQRCQFKQLGIRSVYEYIELYYDSNVCFTTEI